jgi:hypothetical protein
VDNSTIAYDSRRDRVLIISSRGYNVPYDGQVHALDMKSNRVTAFSPPELDAAKARQFAYVDRCCYDAANDVVLLASYLKDAGNHTPTPAFDCESNRWIALDLKYPTGTRHGQTTREFPHGRSCGIMFDPQRKLIWGTDASSQVYVLRLDVKQAITGHSENQKTMNNTSGRLSELTSRVCSANRRRESGRATRPARNTEPNVIDLELWQDLTTLGGPDSILAIAVPAAANDALRARVSSRWIALRGTAVGPVQIGAPFPHVPVHVI